MPAVVAGIAEAREAISAIKERLETLGYRVTPRQEDTRLSRDWPNIFPGPHQLPPEPHHYVERQDNEAGWTIETTLNQTLCTEGGPLLTILFGMSGTGKSSLTVHVVCGLKAADFPDGILWGDLANLTPNDQILNFLDLLERGPHRIQLPQSASLRDRLWQALADKRALIVLDNVKDARQLIDLLPPNSKAAGQSRVLAISLQPLHDALLPTAASIQLNPFSEQEAQKLFRTALGEEAYRLYETRLGEIARRLEYLPQLLATAAHDFSTGKVSPNTYAQALRHHNGQASLLGNAVQDGLDLAFRELRPEEAELIELVGIFGEGDWRDTMLAAVALQPLDQVRRTLSALVDRSLVQIVGNQRYRVNTLIREFAFRRFSKQSEFRRQAAYTLLAHYCLDLAQDIETALRARPDLSRATRHGDHGDEEEFVLAFRHGLMPEMAHVRVALRWALEREAWDILRRFAHLAYFELLKNFMATGFEIRIVLTLATLYEPVVRRHGTTSQLQITSLISSTEWSLRRAGSTEQVLVQGGIADNVLIESPLHDDREDKCELALDITTGSIIDGSLQSLNLVNANWNAVRAKGLICHDVDIVGSSIVACDLSQSVLLDCDARHTTLRSSNLSFALLRQVKLRGADLSGVTFTGAVLEEVDLRDANLRGVIFNDALLDHVDFRGADLQGASFVRASLRFVNLRDVRLGQVRWAGATLDDQTIFVEDSSFLREITLAAQVPVDVDELGGRRRGRPIAELLQGSKATTEDADLRGAPLTGLDLRGIKLNGCDLQAAVLTNAVLVETNLASANLSAANLSDADLTGAMLRGANLRAAQLSGATLTKADLSEANLRRACCDQAIMPGVILGGADLSYATLVGANLSGAILKGAHLERILLSKATLANAQLDRVSLHLCNASEADLHMAAIVQVDCRESGFMKTLLTDARLSGVFDQTSFESAIMERANLDGTFSHVDFGTAVLAQAQLSGIYSDVSFAEVDLRAARVTGRFVNTSFRGAQLDGADLRDGSLVDCDLSGARVERDQLKTLHRLRGTLLGAGERYDGSFALAGDLKDAAEMGYDLFNADDTRIFYGGGRIPFRFV